MTQGFHASRDVILDVATSSGAARQGRTLASTCGVIGHAFPHPMVITRLAASTTSSVRGVGTSATTGHRSRPAPHQYGVDKLAICYWSAVFGSRRVGLGVTGVPDSDQKWK